MLNRKLRTADMCVFNTAVSTGIFSGLFAFNFNIDSPASSTVNLP